jgi:hypothetical protein
MPLPAIDLNRRFKIGASPGESGFPPETADVRNITVSGQLR